MIEYLPRVEEARSVHETGVDALVRRVGTTAIEPVTAVKLVNEILVSGAEKDHIDYRYLMMADAVLENRLKAPDALNYLSNIQALPLRNRILATLRAHADLHGTDLIWKWHKAWPLIRQPVEESEIQPTGIESWHS